MESKGLKTVGDQKPQGQHWFCQTLKRVPVGDVATLYDSVHQSPWKNMRTSLGRPAADGRRQDDVTPVLQVLALNVTIAKQEEESADGAPCMTVGADDSEA